MILSGFLLWGCGRKGAEDPIAVIVKPDFFQLPVGGEVQFSAEVFGTLDKAVQWEQKGAGGSISPSGLYKAPLKVTPCVVSTAPPVTPPLATIQAKSVADPAAVGNGSAGTTVVRECPGEELRSDMRSLVIGGYTVRQGQTIDMNGDNVLDLISLSKAENAVAFFLGLGRGDGSFTTMNQVPPVTVLEPVAVAVADFITENEFTADAAIACVAACAQGRPNIVLIQGRTQADFSIASGPDLVLPSGKVPILLAAGRFHGDVEARNSDLVVGTEDGSVVLFLQNRGAGTFTQTTPITVGKPVQFEVADFNQDIFLDLAVVREGAPDVLILLGNGVDGFSSPVSVPMPAQPTSIDVGDFNADEIPDLAAAFSSRKTVLISIGKGDGTFQDRPPIVLNSEPESIVVEDVNLDRIQPTPQIKGNPRHDIGVSLPNRGEIYVLFGDGEGNMIGNWAYKTGVAPRSLRAGFFSGSQSPTGFQTVSLVYINEDLPKPKFFLVNNSNVSP